VSGEEFELDCAAVIADIWLVLDNECDQESRARLQHHLDTCPPCLVHYGLEEKIKGLLSRKCGGDRAPDALRKRLRVEIHKTILTRTAESE